MTLEEPALSRISQKAETSEEVSSFVAIAPHCIGRRQKGREQFKNLVSPTGTEEAQLPLNQAGDPPG
jgi:hypothetical protein